MAVVRDVVRRGLQAARQDHRPGESQFAVKSALTLVQRSHSAILICLQCNNPLTKEAKLTAAMRIVSEWKDYDSEVKNLQNKLNRIETEKDGDLRSGKSAFQKTGE